MAPHSSTLAWKIPWTEEPGGLQSMGLHASSSVTDLVMNVPQKFRVENASLYICIDSSHLYHSCYFMNQ